MRFIHLLSAWLACALLAAGPAQAWDATKCLNIATQEEFRDKLADLILNPRDQANWKFVQAENDPTKYMENIAYFYRTCRSSLEEHPQELASFESSMGRLEGYFADLLAGEEPQNGLGLVMSNHDFFTSYKTILAVPACLADTQLFRDLQATNLSTLMSVDQTVSRIETQCPKAIVLPFVTATIDSIDNARGVDRRGRILVWIGGNNISHYVQFSVNANSDSKSGTAPGAIQRKQASVVKIKSDDKGGPRGTYIFDWQRVGANKFQELDTYGQTFGNQGACYACHWTGVLAIHPFKPPTNPKEDVGKAGESLGPGSLGPNGWLIELNEKYAIAAANMNKQIKTDQGNYSTVVGAPTLEAFPDLLQNPSAVKDKDGKPVCTASQQQAITQLKATDCTKSSCHASRGRGMYQVTSYNDLMTKYVAGGLMPMPKPTLDNVLTYGQDARQCFENAAKERVKAWFRGSKQ